MEKIEEYAEIILGMQPMTHKKLQKILYYMYSWYYTIYNKKLFDEYFEAWVHGPVSPKIYTKYKIYGWSEISKGYIPENPSSYEYIFAKKILDIYGDMDAEQLEECTHNELPWKRARVGVSKYASSNNIISDNDISRFYIKQTENYNYLKAVYRQ